MTLIAYGINHSTAPIEIREKLIFDNDIITDALNELKHKNGVHEAAILSTCNRTEIYCSVDQQNDHSPVEWLHDFHGMKQDQLQPFLYKHPDHNAVRHVLRVASGLDSMILGEPQVLGQLKNAYHKAISAGSIGLQLNRLFQHSFHVAKEVRSNTAIGNHPISVAYAAVRLAQQIFGDLKDQTALLIGAGETIELAAKHLYENDLNRMIIANRTLERSQRLAYRFSGYAIQIGDIASHLPEADIVISSTASMLPILDKRTVESAIRVRKHKPMFMVDIAVPRDIDFEIGDMDDIYLYSVDDLKDIVQDNLKNRQDAAKQAEKIVDAQAQGFMDWVSSLDAVSTIKALRGQAEQIKDEVIKKALIKLRNGADSEIVLLETARNLTNKLIHIPSSTLKNASAQNRVDLLQAAEELYSLREYFEYKNKKH
ncbi:MAG: glutamyl-tRNA reductase [Legionellales bacterium]|nr:glutamyl-tRNA reductase [Legionellales bacterium]|tara:strand:- start:641 stop:1921 length:1281 start_codon:yes stop_codon:yes gene_type:complete